MTHIYLNPPPNFKAQVEAAGCILESDGRLLLLKRAPNRFEPNTWCIPGGKLEPGESPKEAVIRELREETQIDICHPELQYIGALYKDLTDLNYSCIFHIFYLSPPLKPVPHIDHSEHTDFDWTTPGDTTLLPLIRGGKETIELYLAYLKKIARHSQRNT